MGPCTLATPSPNPLPQGEGEDWPNIGIASASYSIRNSAGQMMPLSNVVSIRDAAAPQAIGHYNLFRSAEIDGSAAPGRSSALMRLTLGSCRISSRLSLSLCYETKTLGSELRDITAY